MKKLTSISAIFSICCLMIPFSYGISQTQMKKQMLISPVMLSDVERLYEASAVGNSSEASVFAIDQKAMRDFRKTFKDINNEKWYILSNGFVAEFLNDDIKNVVVYDKKGNWLFSICYYNEKKLAPDIRAIIKGTYYDYTITRVEEIHVPEKIIYLVHMEDQTTWKNVRVSDGEMELIEDFSKY
jgi:hypothetical protein